MAATTQNPPPARPGRLYNQIGSAQDRTEIRGVPMTRRPWPLLDAVARWAGRLDRRTGWDRLHVPLGLLTLFGLRQTMREENLYDSYGGSPPPGPADPGDHASRTVDG